METNSHYVIQVLNPPATASEVLGSQATITTQLGFLIMTVLEAPVICWKSVLPGASVCPQVSPVISVQPFRCVTWPHPPIRPHGAVACATCSLARPAGEASGVGIL